MSTWVHKLGKGGRLEIETDALSDILTEKFGGEVDDVARAATNIAKAQMPTAPAKKPIGMKSHTVTPSGRPNFALRSSRLTSLARQLRVPVALVVNNSKWAVDAEVGKAVRQANGRYKNQRAYKPLRTAIVQMKVRPGIRAIVNNDNSIAKASASVRRSQGGQKRGGSR